MNKALWIVVGGLVSTAIVACDSDSNARLDAAADAAVEAALNDDAMTIDGTVNVDATPVDARAEAAIDVGLDLQSDAPPDLIGLEVTPYDGIAHVAPDVVVQLNFFTSINASTATAQATNGACTGSIQLSADDFATCVGGSLDASSSPVTFTPAAPLALATTYKVRVTTALQSEDGGSLEETFTMHEGFTTYRVEGERLVFATTRRHTGNLGGVAGADAECNTDSAVPTATGSTRQYKALLVADSRVACSVASCGEGSTSTDWVLTPNTTYVRRDGEVLFVSNDQAIVDEVDHPLFDTGGTNFWGGFSTARDWTAADTCGNWTSDSSSQSSTVGWTTTTVGADFIGGGTVMCSTTWRLLCVEQ